MRTETRLCLAINWDILMTGEEEWPILGTAIRRATTREILLKFKGLKYYWSCLEKAEITKSIIGGVLCVGSTHILSTNGGGGSYGFNFKPPFGFHAWVEKDQNIIDLALPGVIEMGLQFEDEYGPYLVGNKPVILASRPKDNEFLYKAYERH